AGEMNVRDAKRRGKLVEEREIAFEPRVASDDNQTRPGVENRLIGVEEADEILDPLVRNDPAHKHDVGPRVVELTGDEPVWWAIEMGKVGHHRQHCCSWESELLEILPVELGVAERDLATGGIRTQFPAAPKALARESSVDSHEILRRRDVVIDK